MSSLLQNRRILSAMLMVAGFLAYIQTLSGSFVFDDYPVIIENRLLRSGIVDIFTWAPLRFLPHLSFAINYTIGGTQPLSYHLLNIAIHVLTGYCVFLFLSQLIKGTMNTTVSPLVPFFAAMIFILHPLQTQAVSYIVQRTASMAALFYLSSLLFLLKSVDTKKMSPLYYSLALLSQCAAYFSKEFTFTLPVIVMLLLFVLGKKLRFAFPFFLCAGLMYVLFLSPYGLHFNNPAATSLLPAESTASGRYEYLLTQLHVVPMYIRLFFLPYGQNIDYDIPIVTSMTGTTGMFLCLIAGCIMLAIRIKNRNALLSFGILFFFITLTPESSVIPIADVINEHRMYLPLTGLLIALCGIYFSIRHRIRSSMIYPATGIICLLLGLTLLRNMVWQSDITLWSDSVSKSPRKARPHFALGRAYVSAGKNEKAKKEFETTITLDPHHYAAYSNLGALYVGNDNKKAEMYFLKSLQIQPDHPTALLNLAIIHTNQKNYEKAYGEFEQVLKKDTKNVVAYFGLGTIYIQTGEHDKAKNAFTRALSFDPQFRPAREALMKLQ